MVHDTPTEWTCLCYFYILWQYKAFHFKHYSKQTVPLKGEGEENKMNECSFYPLYRHISTLAVLHRLSCTRMEPQPQYKNRSKGNQQSICPSRNVFFFFFFWNYLNSYNMMFVINYIFPSCWMDGSLRGGRGRGGKGGGEGSRCTVRVLFWNIHSNVGPTEMMANVWAGGWGRGSVVWWQFTSWHLWLRRRHPPPPLAAVDAIGRWGGGGWPACRTSVSARPPWPCSPPGSCQWHRSCQSCHNPGLWLQPGFSVVMERKNSESAQTWRVGRFQSCSLIEEGLWSSHGQETRACTGVYPPC